MSNNLAENNSSGGVFFCGKLNELKVQIMELNQKLAATTDENEELKTENSGLKEKFTKSETEYMKLEAAFKGLEKDMDKLKNDLEGTQNDCEELKIQKDQLNTLLENTKAKNLLSQGNLEKKNFEINELREKLKDTEIDKLEMERAHNQLETSYLTLQDTCSSLKKTIETLTKSRDQKDKHLAIIHKENERLHKKLEMAGDAKTEVMAENYEPNVEKKEVKKTVKTTQKKIIYKPLGHITGLTKESSDTYSKQKRAKLKQLAKLKNTK
ncbi:unnamed protein product [Moneuplotes crassus]|uniref:Uncharacterized protein n=1 Tax=Euplotes crassus TaxID=5936 RepID=A0AAD1XT41_EUPCR|nr:unnamed protein product [Moneuplotes crassus]